MKDSISPEVQIEESKTIIKAVLKLNISNYMKRKVIGTMIWNITGANGKYELPFISVLAKENPNLKVNHEHIFRKKILVDEILLNPDNLENILENAVACVVTLEEHNRLNQADKENPKIDGWERYNLAKIKVWDNINSKILEL